MKSTSSFGFKIKEGFLLLSSSSVNELLHDLQRLEKRLGWEMPSGWMKQAMQPAIKTLMATELRRHPDMEVNISVACCICEVFRIMVYQTPYNDDEQMKDFFELLVSTFEKLSSASGGCYDKMVKVLRTLDIGKICVMMCDLQLDELIVQLFKQFLTVADSNSAAVVVHMKQIMVMIIQKTEPVNRMLVDLLVTSVEKDNKTSSPVCWQLVRDVLAQLKPHLPKKVAEEVYGPLMEAIPSTTRTSKLGNHATRKRRRDCLDGSSNMVRPVRRCRDVREREKKSLSTVDPPTPTKSATEVNGKVAEEVYVPLMETIPSTTSTSKLGNDATRRRKCERLDGSSNMVQPVRRCQNVRECKKKSLSTVDPPTPTISVTETQSGEDGENLVGRRIKVWSSSDKTYYRGVVKSFDCRNKRHKVLYDDGDEDLLDLKQGGWELVKMASNLSTFDIKLIKAGKELLILPSSTAEILNILKQAEQLLQSVQLRKGIHRLSESMKYAMHPIIEALTAKELLRHPDMDVNISVACCICDVLRTMEGNAAYTNEQMKDFFELAVTTFEKVSSASGGCYTSLFKVLKTLSGLSFSVLESDLRLKGLIVRLFKQFLTVADSNSLLVVLEMKNILTIIIEESEPLNLELVYLLVTSVRKENQITSPVCWKLGNEVLQKCAAKLKPHLQDKVSETEGSSLKETIEPETNTSELTKNAIQNMQIGCLDESRNRVQPVRRSNDATSDSVNIHSEVEKKTLSPSMPSTSVIEVSSDDDDDDKELIFLKGKKGKLLENVSAAPVGQAPPLGDIVSVQGYSVKQSIAPILEDIFNKHGDILADCAFQIASVKTCFIEVICEVARTIETSDNATIISKMEEIESKVSQAAAANINVSWLRDQLKTIIRNEALKKTALLKEMKLNTILAKQAARADLRIAQEQFAKAERCVKVLELIEEKLSKDINEIKS